MRVPRAFAPGATGCLSANVHAVGLQAISAEMAHPKRVRHCHEPGHCHELTFSCCRRMPLLTDHVRRSMPAVSVGRTVAGRVLGSYRTSKWTEPGWPACTGWQALAPGVICAKHRAPTGGWSGPFRQMTPAPFFSHGCRPSLVSPLCSAGRLNLYDRLCPFSAA